MVRLVPLTDPGYTLDTGMMDVAKVNGIHLFVLVVWRTPGKSTGGTQSRGHRAGK